MSRDHSVASTVFPRSKFNNSLFINQYTKKSIDATSKHKIKLKNSNYKYKYSSMIPIIKKKFSELKDIKSIRQIEKNSTKLSKLNSMKYHSPEINKSSIYKKKFGLFTSLNLGSSRKSVDKNGSEKIYDNLKNKYDQRKESKKNLNIASEDQELNFYGKMQTLHGNSNNIATINCINDLLKSSVKKS